MKFPLYSRLLILLIAGLFFSLSNYAQDFKVSFGDNTKMKYDFDEGLDGSFFGLAYDRTRYNSSSKRIVTGSGNSGSPVFSSDYFKENETISDINASFGWQTLYDRIGVEYSLGIALRKVTGRKYAYTNDYNGNGNYIEGYTDLNKTTPAFTFSIRIGYHY